MDPGVSFLVSPSGFYLFKELMQAFCLFFLGMDKAEISHCLVDEIWALPGTWCVNTGLLAEES